MELRHHTFGMPWKHVLICFSTLLFQDGRIDYNEFVAMMHKGNAGAVGKKGLETSFSIKFVEAFKP